MIDVHAVVKPRQFIRMRFILDNLNGELFRVLGQGGHESLREASYRTFSRRLYRYSLADLVSSWLDLCTMNNAYAGLSPR